MTKAFSECINITAVETDAEFKEIHMTHFGFNISKK
jgi:hypothetical protein